MQEDTPFSKELIEHLLIDLSIWIPSNFYTKLPVILPYVVRDNSCRIKTSSGHDEWGSANSRGYLRDDNTLLKGIVRSFHIKSANIPAYDGKKLGIGFVASHIWGKLTVDNNRLISSRHHMLNSFVPNLVWLPVQISKLTDREGSYAQRFLQAISYQIYKNIDLPKELSPIWETLSYPQGVPTIEINLDKINYFDVSDDWLTKRVNGLVLEINTILSVNNKNENLKLDKIKSSRYLPTLKQTPLQQREELYEWLSKYRSFLNRNLTSDAQTAGG